MAEPFKQKQKSLERDESITGLAKEVLNKKKKPVKFTWRGFANLASSFLETNPFDKLKLEIINLEKQHKFLNHKDSPKNSVGFRPSKTFKKVKHSIPMLSLNNAFDKDDLINFEKKILNFEL